MTLRSASKSSGTLPYTALNHNEPEMTNEMFRNGLLCLLEPSASSQELNGLDLCEFVSVDLMSFAVRCQD